MKPWLALLFSLFLAACSTTDPTVQSSFLVSVEPFSTYAPPEPPMSSPTTESALKTTYPDLGPAPELHGNVWLNSEVPLHLKNLHGKVVLVDMWTYG